MLQKLPENDVRAVANYFISKFEEDRPNNGFARFTFQVPHPGLLISLSIASNGVR